MTNKITKKQLNDLIDSNMIEFFGYDFCIIEKFFKSQELANTLSGAVKYKLEKQNEKNT